MSNPHRARAISPQGEFLIRTIGRPAAPLRDLFHDLLVMSWPSFLLRVVFVWLATNLVFATIYKLDPGGVANMREGSYADAFFFSVQTLSTIGYGAMAPQSFFAQVVVASEAFLGTIGTALVTGLMFAKFSRPTARVQFTERAVIAERDGVPTLMVRLANARDHGIMDASAHLTLIEPTRTAEGEPIRRFHDLALERSRTPLLNLTWTLVHPITPESPLHGHDAESLAAIQAEIVAVVRGVDITIAQPVSMRRSYVACELVWDKRFADMMSRAPDGSIVADCQRFNELVDNVPASSAG